MSSYYRLDMCRRLQQYGECKRGTAGKSYPAQEAWKSRKCFYEMSLMITKFST